MKKRTLTLSANFWEALREAAQLVREINEIEPDKILNASAGKDKQ